MSRLEKMVTLLARVEERRQLPRGVREDSAELESPPPSDSIGTLLSQDQASQGSSDISAEVARSGSIAPALPDLLESDPAPLVEEASALPTPVGILPPEVAAAEPIIEFVGQTAEPTFAEALDIALALRVRGKA